MEQENPFKLDVVSIRLVKDAPIYSDREINTPVATIHLVGEVLCEMDREMVCVINLKRNNIPVNCNFASIGALDYAIAQPREILKSSILSNAAGMLMVHNHVDGNLLPSKEDIRLTARIQNVAELVGIPLIDHIIVGGDNRKYFSFHEKGMIKNPYAVIGMDYENTEKTAGIVVQPEERGVGR